MTSMQPEDLIRKAEALARHAAELAQQADALWIEPPRELLPRSCFPFLLLP